MINESDKRFKQIVFIVILGMVMLSISQIDLPAYIQITIQGFMLMIAGTFLMCNRKTK